jgi:hypothetical protein
MIMKEWGLYLWMYDQDQRRDDAFPARSATALAGVAAAVFALAVCGAVLLG